MASLDMSLDDTIRNRRSSRRGRGQGRAIHGPGPGGSFRGGRFSMLSHRGPLGVNVRPSANMIAKSFRRTKNFPWQRDLFENSNRVSGFSGLENCTKLFVSNLDVGVTNEDIRVLFSEIGELRRYALHYGKNGCPIGSAEVVFMRRSDTFLAVKRYDNVQLDGKQMKIEIVDAYSEIPFSACMKVVGGLKGRKRTNGRIFSQVRNGHWDNNRGYARGRGGGSHGRSWDRGQGRRAVWKPVNERHVDVAET